MSAHHARTIHLPRPAIGRRRAVRELIRTGHRWIGLSLGLVLVIAGLTGSWLAFYPELDLLLHPQRRAQGPVQPIRLNAVFAALQAAEPQRDGPWRIEMPRGEGTPIQARYYQPSETRGQHFAPLMLTLSPTDLTVSSRHFWGDDPSTWLYNLHYALLLGETGQTLLACCGILFLALLLSGIYLWWPRPGAWRGALTIKPNAAWKRLIYDWHVKPGVYTLLISLTLCITGLMLVVPAWFSPALNYFSPITAGYTGTGSSAGTVQSVSAEQAVAIAQKRFPDAELHWLETPGAGKPIWRVQMRQPGEPSQRFPRTQVWIDASTGDILAERDPRRFAASDTLLAWLHPLHNGEAFGLAGRIVVCLAGLLPLLALTTGFIRWRHTAGGRKKR